MKSSYHNEKEILISLSGVSFSYGDNQILNDAKLEIHRGDYLGIVGSNGSGKTTLLKILLGLLIPAKGSVSIFGKNITEFKNNGRLGYVPQNAIQRDPFFPATVYDVVRMGIQKNGHDADKIKKALATVDMEQYVNTFVRNLSGGQQQRIFIARALVENPEILILDEPSVGLSREVRESFFTLLRTLNEEYKITIVLITHDIGHAAHDALHAACIIDGKICYHETVHSALHREHYHEH